MNPRKILVIKHGSLGDIISATCVFKSLRDHFQNAEIHLLTSEKYKEFLQDSNFFDTIIVDNRNKGLQNINLIFNLIFNNYDLVVDLQNSQRTMIYGLFFRILKSTKWNGTRAGSTIKYAYDPANPPHVIDGLVNQIKLLSIDCEKRPHLDWLKTDYVLPDEIKNKPFFLINPGSSHPIKKWPSIYFAEICEYLLKKNIKPVLIGFGDDKDIINDILLKTDSPINLYNISPLNVVFSLANLARGALSNDTGPAHLIAGTSCKIHLVLSSFTKKSVFAPRGNNVSYTQKENIKDIVPKEIIGVLNNMLNI